MIRWVFLFGFLALADSLSAANLPVKRYALFIGANQGGKAQQPLLFAQRDALKMQEVMQEVGGVGPADQVLLLDPTPDGIRGALGALASKMSGSGVPETRRTEFLFYYSGHSDETGLLLGDRTFSYNDLRTGLQSVPADVRIAILDSCSSGAFARLKGGVQRDPFLDQLPGREARALEEGACLVGVDLHADAPFGGHIDWREGGSVVGCGQGPCVAVRKDSHAVGEKLRAMGAY